MTHPVQCINMYYYQLSMHYQGIVSAELIDNDLASEMLPAFDERGEEFLPWSKKRGISKIKSGI